MKRILMHDLDSRLEMCEQRTFRRSRGPFLPRFTRRPLTDVQILEIILKTVNIGFVIFSIYLFLLWNNQKEMGIEIRQFDENHLQNNSGIPLIIHQLWNSPNVPLKLLPYMDTWIEMHPNWQYWFWTNFSQGELVKTKFPDYLELYNGYQYDIQRVDLVRFLILYEYGGIYADLDMEVIKPLDSIATTTNCLVATEPEEVATIFFRMKIGYLTGNALIGCRPKHPFLKLVLKLLLESRDGRTVMDSTGPLVVNKAVEQYIRNNSRNCSTPDLMVAPSEMFIPTFADLHIRALRNSCIEIMTSAKETPALNMDETFPKMILTCHKLIAKNFTRHPTDRSHTIHHWSGMWYGENDGGQIRAKFDSDFDNRHQTVNILRHLPNLKKEIGVLKLRSK